MGLFDEQLNKMESLLGQIGEAGKTGATAKPKIKMSAAQAQAGVRTATAAPAVGAGAARSGALQAAKGIGKGVLKGALKFGGAPLGVGFLLYEILSKTSEGRKYLSEADVSTRPPTAEAMLEELDDQRRRRAAVASAEQNDPEMMESLRWMLSGQQRPDLTPNQVMFGSTPTTDQVPPEAIREALAAMSGEA